MELPNTTEQKKPTTGEDTDIDRDREKDINKAREMAKAENPYKILAINSRKAGFADLAEAYEKKSGEESLKAAGQWEYKLTKISKAIKETVEQIFLDKNKIKEGISKNSKIPFDYDPDYTNKLEQVLGVEEKPFEEGVQLKRYKTNLEGVNIQKLFNEDGTLNRYYLEIQS